MFVPVWTSRQVRTADCYLIVTARRRLSRNRFLLSSVCMSNLAWRRTEQAHRPIGSVGSNRLDQSEASCEQAHRPIRSVSRTSASTNQKHQAQEHRPIRSVRRNHIDQSEELGEQAHQPIRRVSRSREGAAQPIRFRLAGSIGGRLVTPEGRTFFGLISFLRILHQVRSVGSVNHIHRLD